MSKPEWIARQSANPQGLVGHVVARVMARETAPINRLVLNALDARPNERILELGSGHGRALRAVIDRIGEGEVVGVDPSSVMCTVAARYNKAKIESGQIRVERGDSSRIPFPNDRFDKAFSVHTLYFWPDLDAGLRELHRVLHPDGTLLLAFHSSENLAVAENLPTSVYTLRTGAEVEEALTKAGFKEVAISTLPQNELRLARALA